MVSWRQIAIDLEVHRAIERARLGLGESENDILRRLAAVASCGLGRHRARRLRRPRAAADGPQPRTLVGRDRAGGAFRPPSSSRPIASCCASWRRRTPISSRRSPRKPDVHGASSPDRPPRLYARSPHLARSCRAARRRLVFRLESVGGADRQARAESRRGCAGCITGRTCASSTICGKSERSGRRDHLLDRAEDRVAVARRPSRSGPCRRP